MKTLSVPSVLASCDRHGLSRRAVLGGLAGSGMMLPAGGVGAQTSPQTLREPASLGELAASKGILFGASSAWEVIKDPGYGALMAREARLLVTDHALKFDFIRPREDVFDYEEADALLDFARRKGMQLRGHTLIWNDNPPPWLKGKSNAELIRIFDEHIERVGARYVGRLHSWDVVNEPFWPGQGNPGGWRSGPWYTAMGEGYVERAFKRLGRVDTVTPFVLNEAQTERQDEVGLPIRAGMLKLIDRLQDAGVRLDAIGLQAHLQPHFKFDLDAFLRFLDELTKRKLTIYLTEFDVDDRSMPREQSKRDEEVAQWTRMFLGAVLKNPAVTTVITWHLSDKYTWYRDPEVAAHRKRDFQARSLPFDDQFKDKPMARAMREVFAAAPMRY